MKACISGSRLTLFVKMTWKLRGVPPVPLLVRIFFIRNSTAGNNGYPHYADYSASKGGVIALTQAMALELAPVVRVNAISPGYVLTPMQRAEYTDEMLDAVNRKIPLGRHAKPEEIAALFAFLASEDAAFATGHVYVMDGAETTGGLCSQWAHN